MVGIYLEILDRYVLLQQKKGSIVIGKIVDEGIVYQPIDPIPVFRGLPLMAAMSASAALCQRAVRF